jgi:hypothetical protein
MKVRNGFVSNSSASSFVVKFKDPYNFDKPEPFIDEKQIKKLEKFGFWKSNAPLPSHVSWRACYDDDKSLAKAKGEKDHWSYAYSVSCNEYDVLIFLIDNKIPFKSLCHYDHYYVSFDGKNKIIVARNYGMELMGAEELYLEDMKESGELKNPKPVKIMTVKKFKKQGYSL